MKAFVMQRIGKVALTDKPSLGDPGPNDAIVRTTLAAICTSDTHTVKGAFGQRENLTLGHEAVGVVERVGSEVKSVAVGDRVLAAAITPCFHCVNCVRGFTSQCNEMLGGWKFANINDGVFAEYFHVNNADANLTIIPDELPDEIAVYTTDMMSTGFVGAENADIPIGGKVRMASLLRLLQFGRVDPTPLTTHTFDFEKIETVFSMMQDKADGIIEPLIRF